MSWPAVSGSTPGFLATGVTTVRWGTDGLLQSPKPAVSTPGLQYYFVLRFNQDALIENIKLPNGTGITATRILLQDGVEFTITVRDDTRMTPPVAGGSISIVDGYGLLGVVGLVYAATVVNPKYEVAAKQAGERTIVMENLVLIESQTGGSQV